MVEHRPLMTAFSHLVLIGGVLLVALPIWITFVASTLTRSRLGSPARPADARQHGSRKGGQGDRAE
jgi:sn-glycerol 3-phosphate transport system permease protein